MGAGAPLKRPLLALALSLAACGGDPPPPPVDLGMAPCATDRDCDNTVFCDGPEVCRPSDDAADGRGCVASDTPACLSAQTCDEANAQCRTRCGTTSDADGDGRVAVECGGDDCDDSDPLRFPGNTEICDAANRDEDCDPATFGFRDQDMDGAPDAACCNDDPNGGDPRCGNDCNDTAPGINPTTSEVCDGFDNDCDGSLDEGVFRLLYRDADGDGFGDPTLPIEADCAGESSDAPNGLDCNDADARIRPGAAELCDGVDTNCDGQRELDIDQDGHLPPDAVCTGGSLPLDDCNDLMSEVYGGAPERCDGRDNDCDTQTDERSDADVLCAGSPGVRASYCIDQACHLAACEAGRGDCNHASEDGCEVVFESDDANCGACGVRCAFGQTCTEGACAQPVVTSLDVGVAHGCVSLASGRVACWGDNDAFQLGDRTGSDRTSAVPVFAVDDAVSVSLGDHHSCLLAANGETRCWGDNTFTQCGGDGTRAIAPRVIAAPTFAHIFGGAMGHGGLTATGDVWEWGKSFSGGLDFAPRLAPGIATSGAVDGDRLRRCTVDTMGAVQCDGIATFSGPGLFGDDVADHGQRCSLTTVPDGPGFEGDCPGAPVSVIALTGQVDVVVGDYFSCAHDGQVVSCWGRGATGTVGVGTTNDAPLPVVALDVSASGGVDALAAGREHACARVGEDVFCWGDNRFGQAGGDDDPVLSPQAVTPLHAPTLLAAGPHQTCAATADNDVFCWGAQRGDRTNAERRSPSRVAALDPVESVLAGTNRTCLELSGGRVLCNDSAGSMVPPTRVPDARRVFPEHLGCALDAQGELLCWTGAGPAASVGLSGVADYVASGQHRCAILHDGQVLCWGNGARGRLGNGTTDDQASPTPISGPTDAIDVAVGGGHTCIVRQTGRVACWGAGGAGQLGLGTTDDALEPREVPGIDDAVEISAGRRHTCARTVQGRVWCWGEGLTGELGLGAQQVVSPLPAPTGVTNSRQLAGRERYTCSVGSDQQVSCWGSGKLGVLGRGAGHADQYSPVAISGLSARRITAGDDHVCAISDDRSVRCWGLNDAAEMGFVSSCTFSTGSGADSFDGTCGTDSPVILRGF